MNPSLRVELVKKVYNECWKEFSDWKATYARQELINVSYGSDAPTGSSIKIELEETLNDHDALLDSFPRLHVSYDLEDDDEENIDPDVEFEQEYMTMWQFDTETASTSGPAAAVVQPTTVSVPVFKPSKTIEDFKPVAPYQICSPVVRNIGVTDTGAERDVLEFIPFADEPEFDEMRENYMFDPETGTQKWGQYAWKQENRDPDCELSLSLSTIAVQSCKV